MRLVWIEDFERRKSNEGYRPKLIGTFTEQMCKTGQTSQTDLLETGIDRSLGCVWTVASVVSPLKKQGMVTLFVTKAKREL